MSSTRLLSAAAGYAVVFALCFTLSGSASAAPVLAVNFNNTADGGVSGPNVMIGWRFTTAAPISVSQLGFWDGSANGLGESHAVGIWTTDGPGTPADALLTTTVPSGTAGALVGSSFRMVDVTPMILPAGDYVIGGLLPGNQVDPYKETSDITGFAAASGITYQERRFGGVIGFGRPANTAAGLGSFGPNFTFAVVPEPASLALLTLGALALLRHRRQPD